MKTHQQSIGKNDEWLTPQWILRTLGEFDLDPAAPAVRPWPTAKIHYTNGDDGLILPWYGRVWLNPPFNRKTRIMWMSKMAVHNNGIMLIPVATETEAWKMYVDPFAYAVLFLSRRPHFCYVDGTEAKANSGCSICLVAYGEQNADVLMSSGLGATYRIVK